MNPGFSITGSATNTYSASIGSSVGTFAQTNEYRYTIRGQLRTINNPSLIADKGITQSDSAALFGEQVNYGENTGLVGTPEYNGNISSISWRNKIEVSGQPGVVGGTQGYTFGYDGVDRQTSSSYYNLVGAGATWTQSSVDAFSENVPKYDEMGNIDSLVRKDKSGNVINRLSYKYASNGNKLAGVRDMGTEGFTSSYTYDGNGNMTSDTKKGITLTYNYLDLVDTVKQGTSRLVYTYDATGKKCYKQLITAGVVTSQRHYVENVEATATSSLAKDGQIEFVATPEGRLVNTGGGNYQQEYFVTDHLGNIRVAFRVNTNGTLNLTQVQNYYSFGKDMGDATMNYTASPQNQYKYSSKELQQELSLMNYDFGARHYDPRIGRWTGVDLLAETYENVSPYNYVANSPINNIDPNGMDFSQGIPCPKWGEPSGGLSAGANVLASFAAGLLGSVGNGPVALDKANAPGQQASLQPRSNITSSLNGNGTTVQEGGGDPGGKKKANANQGVAQQSSLDPSPAIYLLSTTFSLLNENATMNINVIKETNSWWTKVTGKLPGSAARDLEAETFTKTATDIIGKRLFGIGVAYSIYSIYQDHSLGNIATNVGDNVVGYLGLTVPGAQIPALIYFGVRFGYDMYQGSKSP